MTLTRHDLKKIEDLLLKQDLRLESKIVKLEIRFEEKLTSFTNEFYTKVDPVLKEVKASQEERKILAAQYQRYNARLKNLETIHPKGKHALTS